jgi:hypothetical protein
VSDNATADGRTSRWYYTGEVRDRALRRLTRPAPAANSSYGRMFLEDASSLLPYGNGRNEGFTATINGSDTTRTVPLITQALPSEFGSQSLQHRLRDFFSSAADLILAYGQAHYELVYVHRGAEEAAGPPDAFRIELIPPGTVHSRRGQLVQYVPPHAAQKHTRKGVGIIPLDPETTIEFRLASDLAKQVRHVLQVLEVASAHVLAQARMLGDPTSGELRIDIAERRRQADRILARATAPIGWDGRGLFRSGQLEPYMVWRQLKFLGFKIQLRETILDRLNAAITTVGHKLNFTARIELGGVPTLDDVRKYQQDLTDGHQNLSDLLRWATQ